MLIRMVEVVEVRETGKALNLGEHVEVKLRSRATNGRMVYVEIDQPLNDPVHFEPLEEMMLVLIPSQSLLAYVAKVLGEPDGPG